ncbi:MAG TPA: MFS transporter [Solirubrobacteraceae bacterium]|jgi:MFS family permease|nr:MFS transporter [Solirubrobacteraceae bacterium]
MAVVLRSPRVRRILAGFTINRLGSFFGLIALLVLVYDQTGSGLAVAGLLLAWQALPAFTVPPLVARAEASVHGRELTGLYLFEAVATGLLAFFASHFWLPVVLLLAWLDGTAALAASALLRAALARAAREEAEHEPAAEAPGDAEGAANAAVNVAFSSTFVLGPALGGVLVAAIGASATLIVDVASFVVCGALLADLRTHVSEAAGDSVRARLIAARDYVRSRARLRTILIVYAGALALFEAAAPIEVAFAKSTLLSGDRGLGLLLTAWGGGAVVGSLVFARLTRRPLAPLLSLGTLAIGLADLGFALSPGLGIACIAAVVGGLGNGIELPAIMGLVQQLSPGEMHGRLMGAVESLTALSLAVGLLIGGALLAALTVRVSFAVVAAATIATAVALFLLTGSPEEPVEPAAPARRGDGAAPEPRIGPAAPDGAPLNDR